MKPHTTYKILLLALIIIGTWSCERDDICADATPTTPHLIIRFYDITNPDELKQVSELTVRGFDANGNELLDILTRTDTDSIVLPLQIQGENMSTVSQFILERDSDVAENDEDDEEPNIDVININYNAEFLYVSRACGYKSIFNNLSINIVPDVDNWIVNNEVLTTTIDNETQAHVILRH